MKTIGIRATPKSVTFAIFDTVGNSVINVEQIKIPAALSAPEALKYVRLSLLDVLKEYSVVSAGIRVTEPNARSISVERIQIEGVVQEAFASSDLQSYYVGQISSISKRLGFERKKFKPLIAGDDDPGVENWNKMSKEAREAILCAMGAKDA